MVRITSTTYDEHGTAHQTVTDHPGQALVLDHDDPARPIKLVPEDGGDFPCCAPCADGEHADDGTGTPCPCCGAGVPDTPTGD